MEDNVTKLTPPAQLSESFVCVRWELAYCSMMVAKVLGDRRKHSSRSSDPTRSVHWAERKIKHQVSNGLLLYAMIVSYSE